MRLREWFILGGLWFAVLVGGVGLCQCRRWWAWRCSERGLLLTGEGIWPPWGYVGRRELLRLASVRGSLRLLTQTLSHEGWLPKGLSALKRTQVAWKWWKIRGHYPPQMPRTAYSQSRPGKKWARPRPHAPSRHTAQISTPLLPSHLRFSLAEEVHSPRNRTGHLSWRWPHPANQFLLRRPFSVLSWYFWSYSPSSIRRQTSTLPSLSSATLAYNIQ